MAIRVILFDDNDERRKSLRYLFEMHDNIELVADYAHCKDSLKIVEDLLPDAILMDIQMPGINGIEAVKLIKKDFPLIPVLMQTVFEDEELIFQAIQAGATGYILKNERPEKIIQAIQELCDGGAPMSPIIAAKVISYFQHTPAAVDYDLTEREKLILKKLAEGMSYKITAVELGISHHTVNSHIRNIYEKLHVKSLGEAVAKAIRERII